MPELPEVEAKRRYIERTSLGRRITRVKVFDERILEDVSPRSLSRRLSGSEFEQVKRRAKFLLITTSADRTLQMHFGMTGDVLFDQGGRDRHAGHRAVLVDPPRRAGGRRGRQTLDNIIVMVPYCDPSGRMAA